MKLHTRGCVIILEYLTDPNLRLQFTIHVIMGKPFPGNPPWGSSHGGTHMPWGTPQWWIPMRTLMVNHDLIRNPLIRNLCKYSGLASIVPCNGYVVIHRENYVDRDAKHTSLHTYGGDRHALAYVSFKKSGGLQISPNYLPGATRATRRHRKSWGSGLLAAAGATGATKRHRKSSPKADPKI